jgi:hypothetical protein
LQRLLAHKYFGGATALIVFQKILGVGIVAFVFDVTRDKLLQMGWFRALYEFVLNLRAGAGGCRAAQDSGFAVDEAPSPPGVTGLHPAFAAGCMQRARRRCNLHQMHGMGANRPIAVKARPASASAPDTHASAIMPVMIVADASTIPIWNAADATS